MSEAKKPAAMVDIHPGSPEWQAWLTHHRGTKSETRMLLCLGGKTKAGEIIPPRPWLARSKFPPDGPRPENAPRSFAQVAPSWSPPAERRSPPEGRFDEVVNRTTAVEERRVKENEINHRRRKETRRSEKMLEAALEAAAVNHEPYINGAEYLGTIEVPDPLEEQEIIRAGRGHFVRKKKDAVLRTRVISLRDDPVGRMAKRGHLGRGAECAARLKAARHWQRLYEKAEIGGAKGIDPTRDHVDGGKYEMGNTDDRLAASEQLARLNNTLGKEGGHLVLRILGQKMEIRQVALMMGTLGTSKTMDEKVLDRLGWRFRECLDTLAGELGYAVEAKGRPAPRDTHTTMARYGDNPELHRAVHRAQRRY